MLRPILALSICAGLLGGAFDHLDAQQVIEPRTSLTQATPVLRGSPLILVPQQVTAPLISIAQATAVLHRAPFIVPRLPVAAITARPCGFGSCRDSLIVEVEQIVDSTTHIVISQWSYFGGMSRCERDPSTPSCALSQYASQEPQPQAVLRGVWVEIRGPLPERVLARFIDALRPYLVTPVGS